MKKTYLTTDGVECCTECLRPALNVQPNEALYFASKRALKYLSARLKGDYFSPNEDLFSARELAQAIALVEKDTHDRELVDRR